jgi:hypothetical protein
MRRTFAVTAGIGAIAAVSVALLAPTGAGAAQTPPVPVVAPTNIDAMCQKLPDLTAGVTDGLARDAGALTSANETLASRRTAMTFAMTELADAVVKHLAALDAGASPDGPTGNALKTKQALYVASVVAWSRARTQAFESEQALVFGELQQTLLDSLTESACP